MKNFYLKNKQYLKKSIILGVILVICVLIIALVATLNQDLYEPYIKRVIMITSVFMSMVIPIFLVAVSFLFIMYKFMDSNKLRTYAKISAKKVNNRIALRNSNAIYMWLQLFIFDVLRKNNNYLKLSLGTEHTCLTPKGIARRVKNNSVFYRMELIAPERPDFDNLTLKQIIQGFIIQEINFTGCTGLEPSYKGNHSVFLDNLYYDHANHTIVMDFLYLTSDEDMLYAQRAEKRDMNKQKYAKEMKRLLAILSYKGY